VFKAGAYISINGTTGEVIRGAQPVAKPSSESGDLATFMKWVDARRSLRVLTNAGEQRRAGGFGEFGSYLGTASLPLSTFWDATPLARWGVG
jgi:pyruvate,orthophosphate dikinase